MDTAHNMIWTIGHSTRTIGEFAALLVAHRIEVLADVRSYPSSRRCPWFAGDALGSALYARGIGYVHLPQLGGRRPRQRDVPAGLNAAWANSSFRNYADYATGEAFRSGLAGLQELACGRRVAYMCSEAVPWRCHRLLVSDHLTLSGWRVRHIISTGDPVIHVPGKYGARPVLHDGAVTYPPQWQQLTLLSGTAA